MEMTIRKSNEDFAFFSALFIECFIKLVMKEDDTVQEHVAACTTTQRVCTSCNKRYDNLKLKCDAEYEILFFLILDQSIDTRILHISAYCNVLEFLQHI